MALDQYLNEQISIHALLAESDVPPMVRIHFFPAISIHALLAESDSDCWTCSRCGQDFYPRSPCGERLRQLREPRHPVHFYPRSPCGERRAARAGRTSLTKFLSTLSLRRATARLRAHRLSLAFLSTLSLRRATGVPQATNPFKLFLSTLSLRRATGKQTHPLPVPGHFYPRSPCGERP